MGGIRKWSAPKNGSLDGGLEWNCSQLHFQLEITQDCSGDTKKRGGIFQQAQREDYFSLHGSLHMLVHQLKALKLALGCCLEVIYSPGTTMITQCTYCLSMGQMVSTLISNLL
jgi:hypothetical protein